jgi:predicted negative regulator of RcsB-dependent stress response
MSESKVKTNQNVAPTDTTQPTVVSTKKPRRRLVIILIVLLILIVGAVLSGWIIYKDHHQNKHTNPNIGLTEAIHDTEANVPSSNYKTYEEAYSAGDLYVAKGQESQAYLAYQQALRLTTKPPAGLYMTLGDTATALHKTVDAKQYYNDALHAYDFNTLNGSDKQQIRTEAGQ